MTKSEMRRLQFQRKYTSNEDYEKDKAKFIADIERFTGIQKMLHGTSEHHEAEDLYNLLKQSKWIGAVDPAYDEGYRAGYIDGAKD